MGSFPPLECWRSPRAAAAPLTLRVWPWTLGLWEHEVTSSFHKSSDKPIILDSSRRLLLFILFLVALCNERDPFFVQLLLHFGRRLHTPPPPFEVHTLHAQMRRQLVDGSKSEGDAPRTKKDARIQIALCHTHGNQSAASSGLAPSPPLQSWESPMVSCIHYLCRKL